MKKILFAALAATTLFAACSKDNTGTANATGENVIVVKFPGSETRAVETPIVNGTVLTHADISNAIVFLANSGTGSIMKYEVFTDGEINDNYKRIEQVPNSVDKVIVVANIPEGELVSPGSLTTYEAVTKYAFTVANQNKGDGGIADKTLMGEGSPATATSDPDSHTDHNYKEVTIALDALTARFEIGTVVAGDGIASIKLEGIWINNFYRNGSKADIMFNNSDSPYWVTDPLTSTSPSVNPFSSVTVQPYACEATYYNKVDPRVDAGTHVYAYHVFAGATIPHVIMLVSGEFTDGANKNFLGWVTFRNYFDTGNGAKVASIVPNTIYKMGNITIDKDYLTQYPEESFDLGINCTITPWIEKNVNPSVE